MRHIPTSAATVDKLKKQAKRLQRAGRGKHVDLLDRVAQGAGYDHWHHVTVCQRETDPEVGPHNVGDDGLGSDPAPQLHGLATRERSNG